MGDVLATLAGGQQEKNAYKLEEQSYREQADMAKIEADQKMVQRDLELRRQLASLGTSMAAQGVALGTSGSLAALDFGERSLAKSDMRSIKLMGLGRRRNLLTSAAMSKTKGRAAVIQSYGQAFSQAASYFGKPSSGSNTTSGGPSTSSSSSGRTSYYSSSGYQTDPGGR
jgi:hypothetical protein